MPNKVKKRPNKQHAVKGASWRRFAKEVRHAALSFSSRDSDVLLVVANAAENESDKVSGLR